MKQGLTQKEFFNHISQIQSHIYCIGALLSEIKKRNENKSHLTRLIDTATGYDKKVLINDIEGYGLISKWMKIVLKHEISIEALSEQQIIEKKNAIKEVSKVIKNLKYEFAANIQK